MLAGTEQVKETVPLKPWTGATAKVVALDWPADTVSGERVGGREKSCTAMEPSDELPVSMVSPLYVAVTNWKPALKAEVESVALPELSSVLVPKAVLLPSVKVTVPVGTPRAQSRVTIAVNVTEVPETIVETATEFTDATIEVAVENRLTSDDVAGAKLLSPEYTASKVFVPPACTVVVRVASPAPFSGCGVPTCVQYGTTLIKHQPTPEQPEK